MMKFIWPEALPRVAERTTFPILRLLVRPRLDVVDKMWGHWARPQLPPKGVRRA